MTATASRSEGGPNITSSCAASGRMLPIRGFKCSSRFAGGDAHCGPFFAESALSATLSELAKIAVGAAGNFTLHFAGDSVANLEVKLRFMERQAAWFERFFGPGFDLGQIAGMRRLLARAKAMQGTI
jgi:hypothetical protein